MNIRLTRWTAGGAAAVLFFTTACATLGDEGASGPAIATPPSSQTLAAGGTLELSVAATGAAPLAYQWFKNGGMVAGATNSTLTRIGAGVPDTGVYYVAITNAFGLCLSMPVTVTVGTPQLFAWGLNSYGQLGDGTITNRHSPISVASNVVIASAGGLHSLLLKNDGTLWAMGQNTYGQLGQGDTVSQSNAVSVASQVSSIAAGDLYSLFLKNDGSLWAMGYDGYGQLGDGGGANLGSAVSVASNVTVIAAGESHSLFLKNDGTLWSMGRNDYGQLGDGTLNERKRAVFVCSNAVAVASGGLHSLYLKGDGTLWAMGLNDFGQLGDGTTNNQSRAVFVASDVTAMAAGYHHSLFLKSDGTLWAMGCNDNGQLGDGTATSRHSPFSVGSNVVAMTAGYFHSLFLKGDGTLWSMGKNDYGQLGDGATTQRRTPVRVPGMSLAHVSSQCWGNHTLAVGEPLPPVISGQPVSQTTVAYSNVTFSVAADGLVPLSYQWLFNGSVIGGATATNLTLASVRGADAGGYAVIVSSPGGCATSGVAVLTVINPAGEIGSVTPGPHVWTGLGDGLDGSFVFALAPVGTNLYAGGSFTVAEGSAANDAEWDGMTWNALNSGMDDSVTALAYVGTNLYAGGYFTMAGGVEANYVAMWNGTTWTNLGSGMDGPVSALASDGVNLYAGGSFTTAGGVAANRVAMWNGVCWTNLGSGVLGSSVMALAHDGTNLYAGGEFTKAGGAAASRVAVWNGTAWKGLGSGMNATVFALACAGTNVYAGGAFTTAGGVAANRVARWNGTNWASLGSGMNDSVRALAHDGTNLYAGGLFTEAGDGVAGYVAQWDGAGWTSLSNGVSGWVRALAYDGAYLYAGGYFTNASGVAVSHVAKWEPTFIVDPGVAPDCGSATGGCRVVISGANLCSGADVTGVTLCGVSAAIESQSATQIVVTAGAAAAAGLGSVRIYSSSHGLTEKADGFTYVAADQTIQFPPVSGRITTEDVVRLAASASSGLPVSLTVVSGPGAIAGGSNLTFSATGTVVVAASQAGNGVWNSAPGVTNTIVVVGASVPWHAEVLTDESFGVRSNRFGFTVSGPANLRVVVETCTNLANPVWVPLETNTLTDGQFNFSDSAWTNYPARFYRLRQP